MRADFHSKMATDREDARVETLILGCVDLGLTREQALSLASDLAPVFGARPEQYAAIDRARQGCLAAAA